MAIKMKKIFEEEDDRASSGLAEDQQEWFKDMLEKICEKITEDSGV